MVYFILFQDLLETTTTKKKKTIRNWSLMMVRLWIVLVLWELAIKWNKMYGQQCPNETLGEFSCIWKVAGGLVRHLIGDW